jgi:uncharacterized protein YdhG (YjbR/CyaY superfamily)
MQFESAQSGVRARTSARSSGARLVRDYLAALAPERKRRAAAIRAAILDAADGLVESLRYRMPTFERNGLWVAFASRKAYLAVYFCNGALIDNVRVHHPELDCGVGCVRIRDTQHVPIYELRTAFVQALAPLPDRAAVSAKGREAVVTRTRKK